MSLEDYCINGVTYMSLNNPENTCEGCAGNTNSNVCRELCEYCSYKIWVIKKEDTLQDYIQKIEEKYPEEERNAINPKHYDLFPEHGIQVREVCKVMAKKIEAVGHGAFFISDYVQMLQYLLRFQDKNGLDDLNKAEFYLRKLIEEYHEGKA